MSALGALCRPVLTLYCQLGRLCFPARFDPAGLAALYSARILPRPLLRHPKDRAQWRTHQQRVGCYNHIIIRLRSDRISPIRLPSARSKRVSRHYALHRSIICTKFLKKSFVSKRLFIFPNALRASLKNWNGWGASQTSANIGKTHTTKSVTLAPLLLTFGFNPDFRTLEVPLILLASTLQPLLVG